MDTATMVTTYGVADVAALAFMVSVIVEVLKTLKVLKKFPTDGLVLILSLVITTVSYFGLISYAARPFMWYELVLAFMSSFIVAFIAMFGWDKLATLWTRFKKK